MFEHPRLTGTFRRVFWAVLVAGTLARLYVAFTTRGSTFDITSFELVRDALQSRPLDVYGLVNLPFAPHWPYPPAFFSWILVSDWASDATGLRFDGFIQIAPIAADAAIAWIVQAFLGQRGASDRTRLAAAALVALGPAFAAVSGYHGQIDSVCILPAIVGFWIWTRSDSSQRTLLVGLLIGVGIAIKPLAGLVLLALLPSAGSVRDMIKLGTAAAAAPLVMLLPFLAGSFAETVDGLLGNRGLPGFGGISLLVQPNLSADWLGTDLVAPSPVSQALFDYGALFALAALLLTTAALRARRTRPEVAAVAIWLTFYVFGINFGITYLVMGMAFFLMAGRTREVATLQAGVLIPILMIYVEGGRSLPLVAIYSPIMLGVWAALLWWWVVEIRRALGRGGQPETGPAVRASAA